MIATFSLRASIEQSLRCPILHFVEYFCPVTVAENALDGDFRGDPTEVTELGQAICDDAIS